MSVMDKLFGGLRIAATGLKAERARVDVIAKNIANAHVTRDPATGEAYRREMVDFGPLIVKQDDGTMEAVGVEVLGVRKDMSPFQEIRDPGHADADANGIVRYPNVNTVKEMADLITAVRAYEANLSVQENFEKIADSALRLMQ